MKGSKGALDQFVADLRRLPKVVAQHVCLEAVDAINAMAQATFDAGENPWGNTWEPKEDGSRATLSVSGKLRGLVKYKATGTKLRVDLSGVPYAKYQIGKRPIFPRAGNLPVEYIRELQRVAVEVCRREMHQ